MFDQVAHCLAKAVNVWINVAPYLIWIFNITDRKKKKKKHN